MRHYTTSQLVVRLFIYKQDIVTLTPSNKAQVCGRVPKFMGSYNLWNDIIILSTIPKSSSADLVISLHASTADLHRPA